MGTIRTSVAACLALVMTLVACNPKPNDAGSKAARTLESLGDETKSNYQVVLPGPMELGEKRLVFALLAQDGTFLPSKDLELFYARKATDPAKGPVKVLFEDDGLGDRAFYRATIELKDPGTWLILVREKDSPQGGGTQLQVRQESDVPQVGDKAIVVATPTQQNKMGLADICTRDPEDDLHSISLDAALDSDKPTVVIFATPALCTSKVCGPVVDQVIRVQSSYKEKANFIHVEVFTDQTESRKFTESMGAWHLETEPWTFVIDTDGLVQGRFEGPVTTGEIKAVLDNILR